MAFSPAPLRGNDAALLAAVRQLGLEVKIVPVWAASQYYRCRVTDGVPFPETCVCSKCAALKPGRNGSLRAVRQELMPLKAVSFQDAGLQLTFI